MRKSREKRQDVYGGKKRAFLVFMCRCLDGVELLGNTGNVVPGFIVVMLLVFHRVLFKHMSRVCSWPLFCRVCCFSQRLGWGRKGKLLVAEHAIRDSVAGDSPFIKWAEN